MSSSTYAFHGSDISNSSIGLQWEAQNLSGQTIQAKQQQGLIRIYFFGFTQCPDICPTTLVTLSTLFKQLSPKQAKQVRIVMVTVDPERDTAEILRRYLAHFDDCLQLSDASTPPSTATPASCTPHFEGITGSMEQVKQMAKSFKVFFRKIPLQNGTTYTMEHSANLFVMDKSGKPRLLYYSDVDTALLAEDIRALLAK
nr:SCO family protein [Pelistega europaea]